MNAGLAREMDENTVRRAVRDAYGSRAMGGCCGSPLAGGMSGHVAKLGVGDPAAAATVRSGETVVDLGSGTGVDVFKVSALVGPGGRVIGVDSTPEMIYTARELAHSRGLSNVEFRLGEIEHLPVETESAEVVISDCVINLSPEKAQVFGEAFRVLKPGGRFVVADVVAEKGLPEAIKLDPEAWAGCVAGAIRESDYLEMIRDAGFADVHTVKRMGPFQVGISSIVVSARKPAPVEKGRRLRSAHPRKK